MTVLPTALPVTAKEALQRLQEGNLRYQRNVRNADYFSQARRTELVAGQAPYAIILSCSDSRAPSEILFDSGLGDLFVVRVAGNVAAPSLVGSVEYAAAKFGTELVVVLGHTHCGAVTAALDTIRKRDGFLSDNVTDIVERILPSITEIATCPSLPEHEADRLAHRANVRVAASHLRNGSRLLEKKIYQGRLAVVGAEYDIESGKVEFFDGLDRWPINEDDPAAAERKLSM